MKANLNRAGCLSVTPETELELFALQNWWRMYKKGKVVFKIRLDVDEWSWPEEANDDAP